MAKLGWMVAGSALFFATAAQAVQPTIVDLTHSAASDVQAYGYTDTRTNRTGTVDNDGTGGSYTSYVDETPSQISWLSAAAVSGPDATFTAHSLVGLGFDNTHEAPRLHSTIVPAGMGFYMADTQARSCGANPYVNCPASSVFTFDDLESQFGEVDGAIQLGSVSFDFNIDTENEDYTISGLMTLNINSDGLFFDTSGLGLASTLLNGWVQAFNTPSAFGYAWDETEVDLALAAAFGAQSVTYTTSVTATSNVGCLFSEVGDQACLVAYVGFGDPIGRGGTTTFALRGFDGGESNLEPFTEGLTGIDFRPALFEVPHYENGILSFEFQGLGTVPEPSTWLSMILGFGILGAALRRRRVIAYT